MAFAPTPIDTSDVTLPEPVAQLTEVLARNTHNVWAQRKINEGWRYGPATDTAEKTHCHIVPYEELPESTKEYDRATALSALKSLLKLGYDIVKREEGSKAQ